MIRTDAKVLVEIQDPRIKHLFFEVHGRLPTHDQVTVAALIEKVTDSAEGMTDNDLAYAATHSKPEIDGIIAEYVRDSRVTLHLGGLKTEESDLLVMGVIAHELAHIVLRHGQISLVANVMMGLRPDPICDTEDSKILDEWHEDHADLLAYLWGFERETEAVWNGFERSRKARWAVDIYPITPAMGVTSD